MAINKNSTGYTFVFSIIMVVIVGTSLAYTSLSLKPLQKANAADKKMVDILAAIKVQSSRETAEADFQDYVKERIVIKYSGVAPDSLRRMGEIKSSDKVSTGVTGSDTVEGQYGRIRCETWLSSIYTFFH